jgi:MOSC domain-containing protein YiiM
MGDSRQFLTLMELETRLAALPHSPRDAGKLTRIVVRREKGVREFLNSAVLTIAGGLEGDSWGRDPHRDPEAQLAVMEESIAQLIANGQPLELAGDNLWLDLDLSEKNLPIGSHLQIGAAVLQVTPLPHNGCQKFRARFGDGALQLVSQRSTRPRNLRGIYLRVVEPGRVQAGEIVIVTRGVQNSKNLG